MTPLQAIAAFENYERNVPIALANGLDLWMRLAHKVSVTEFMVGGGLRAPVLPDKLRIRSGDLRRSIEPIPAEPKSGLISGGLRAGNAQVPYPPLHELGTARIKQRAFLLPAIEKTQNQGLTFIDDQLQDLAQRVFG